MSRNTFQQQAYQYYGMIGDSDAVEFQGDLTVDGATTIDNVTTDDTTVNTTLSIKGVVSFDYTANPTYANTDLGYTIQASTGVTTTLTDSTVTNLLSVQIPIGIWILEANIPLLSTGEHGIEGVIYGFSSVNNQLIVNGNVTSLRGFVNGSTYTITDANNWSETTYSCIQVYKATATTTVYLNVEPKFTTTAGVLDTDTTTCIVCTRIG